jgi:hypothetical protein
MAVHRIVLRTIDTKTQIGTKKERKKATKETAMDKEKDSKNRQRKLKLTSKLRVDLIMK